MAASSDTLPAVQSRVSRARIDGPATKIIRIRDELLELYAAMRQEGLAPTTEATYSSTLRFWHEFAQIVGLDVSTFGRLPDDDSGVSRAQIREEDDAFMLFLVNVVKFPRQGKKVKGGGLNTASYAETCLSAVKSHYGKKYDRRPGSKGENGSYQLKLLVKALHKFSPSRRVPRKPILVQHLRAIRRPLDLEGNHWHRVWWALITTSWQSASRFSDLIRGKKVASRKSWDSTDMHRGRVNFEVDKQAPGGISVRLDMPPSKTDTAGEKGFIKYLPVDSHPELVSGGKAICDVLKYEAK